VCLPPELWQCVADFVPLLDLPVLGACCRLFRDRLLYRGAFLDIAGLVGMCRQRHHDPRCTVRRHDSRCTVRRHLARLRLHSHWKPPSNAFVVVDVSGCAVTKRAFQLVPWAAVDQLRVAGCDIAKEDLPVLRARPFLDERELRVCQEPVIGPSGCLEVVWRVADFVALGREAVFSPSFRFAGHSWRGVLFARGNPKFVADGTHVSLYLENESFLAQKRNVRVWFRMSCGSRVHQCRVSFTYSCDVPHRRDIGWHRFLPRVDVHGLLADGELEFKFAIALCDF
jgi:hypothetical protein